MKDDQDPSQPPSNGQPHNASAGSTDGANQPSDPSDLFANLSTLRLNQDFAASLQLSRPLRTVPVRKPPKDGFVRVHPNRDFHFETNVIQLREEGEIFLVAKDLWPDLASEKTFGPRLLVTAMSRTGNVPFIWPIRLPDAVGRLDNWNRSALEIALGEAKDHWVRVTANQALGAYEAMIAPSSDAWGDPVWPKLPMNELLRIAFNGKVITSLEHRALRRLRGEE